MKKSLPKRLTPVERLILQILINPTGDLTVPGMVERINTSRSTINRALRTLKAEELIRMEGYTRIITDKGKAALYGL